MKTRRLVTLGLVGLLTTFSGIQTTMGKPLTEKPQQTIDLNPYKLNNFCFEINNKIGIAVREQKTIPEKFLLQKGNEDLLAVLNGPYFDVNGKTEGLVFL